MIYEYIDKDDLDEVEDDDDDEEEEEEEEDMDEPLLTFGRAVI